MTAGAITAVPKSLGGFAPGDRDSLVHDAGGTRTLCVQADVAGQDLTASSLPARWNPPPLAVVARATS